ALLAGLAMAQVVPEPWRWPAWLAIGVALAAWSRRMRDAGLDGLALAPLAVTICAVAVGIERTRGYAESIVTAAPMPGIADLLALGVLPALALAATAWLLTGAANRRVTGWVAFALALSVVPAVLPAPWHVAGLGAAAAIVIAARLPLPGAAIAGGLVTLAFAWRPIAGVLATIGGSILGDRLPFLLLPPLATILRELTLPAVLIAAALFWRRPPPGVWRSRAIYGVAAVGLVTAYALAKQPLAIASLPRFVDFGVLERVAITHALLGAAWLVAGRQRNVARALAVLGIARFVWFDLLVLNPVLVAQSVGPVPLFNLATLDAALAAAWLWRWRGYQRGRMLLLAATFVTVTVSVRQATHGSTLTGGMDRTENWLYSATMLALAIGWLAAGIRAKLSDVRVAGLALLTAVTLKVFLIDAAALGGILRILSFMGLGFALIGIGWAYRRLVVAETPSVTPSLTD
ncbi:DUF2339 domain-containing protein, partial [Sphingomonas immobilis]